MCRKDWERESNCRDRLVVRTLRCGRSNPGSNPGHGMDKIFFSEASDMKIMVLTKHASAGNRTRINCLEGSYADHYTTDADMGNWKIFYLVI